MDSPHNIVSSARKLFKNTLIVFLYNFLFLLSACSGGSGDGPKKGDPSPAPVNKQGQLTITVNNLATTLDVTWQDRVITLSPDQPDATVTARSALFSAPTFVSPEFQNCVESTTQARNNNYTLSITCDDPATLTLSIEIDNLRGQLISRWADQEHAFVAGDTLGVIRADPGELMRPTIAQMPHMQQCEGMFTRDSSSRLHFTYVIHCVDDTAINTIDASSLAYPVTLKTSGATLRVPSAGSFQFAKATSRLDEVQLDSLGGTHACQLSKGEYSDKPQPTQHWALQCTEFMVYGDDRNGQSGLFLAYSDDTEPVLLEAGKLDNTPTYVMSGSNRHLILNSAFTTIHLDIDQALTTSTAASATDVDQALLTQQGAYFVSPTTHQNQSISIAYHVDRTLTPRRLRGTTSSEQSLKIKSVSPATDTVAVDIFDPKSTTPSKRRLIETISSGIRRGIVRFNIDSDPNVNVIHLVKTPLANPAINLLHSKTDASGMESYFATPSFQATTAHTLTNDPRVNYVAWSSAESTEQLLLSGAGLGALNGDSGNPPRIWELIVETESSATPRSRYGVPKGLEALEHLSVGYMGTDMLGKTLVITADNTTHPDELAAVARAGALIDVDVLKAHMSEANRVRVQFQAGPLIDKIPYKEVTVINGWMLLFSGDAIGEVWVTDGTLAHTWQVDSDVDWANFREGAYQIIGTSKNLVAVSHSSAGSNIYRLFR